MKQTATIAGKRHVKRTCGRWSIETWKNTQAVYPMFWIYPRPEQHALQLTIWRCRYEIRRKPC